MWKDLRKYGLGAALLAGVTALGTMEARAQPVWTGPHIGLHLGVGASEIDWDFTAVGTSANHPGFGFLGGAQIGLNLQLGPTPAPGVFVVGIELDGAWANISGSTSCPNPGFTCQHNVNALASARARAGVLVHPKILIYATGGWGWGHINYGTPPFPTGSFSHTHSGLVLGGGFETIIAQFSQLTFLSLKIEGLAYFLKDGIAPQGTLSGLTDTKLEPTIHTLRVGLNLNF
jgi:outer membrane immunogenic protein